MQGSSTDPRRRLRARRGVLALVATVVATGLLTTGTAVAQQQQPPPAGGGETLPGLDVVVLVDESGSLSPEAVEQEKAAARSVALSLLGPGSTFTAVGFGSQEDNQPGSRGAVDVVCPQRPVDGAVQRDQAASCVDGIRPRTEQEGNNTDHVKALQQALGDLQRGPQSNAKLVLLMTDGKLEVPNSADYGGPATPSDERKRIALDERLPGVMKQLADVRAQVWPIGFGEVDQAELGRFAGGATPCPGQRRPEARTLSGPSDLPNAIVDAFAAATCVDPGVPDSGESSSSGTVLDVNVPAIATDAAILVYKQDPKIAVTYTDPTGKQVESGNVAGSQFVRSGQGTGLESLRIVNPVTGNWKVTLRSLPGAPPVPVSARAVSQGAVTPVLTLSRPAPAPGEEVGLSVYLRTRRGPITDPAASQALTFTTALRADGRLSPPVPLTPDGRGNYVGQVRVPDAPSAALEFVASVSGPGIAPVSVPSRAQTTATTPTLSGQVTVPPVTEVFVGQTLDGSAVVNNTGQPTDLRVVVQSDTPGVDIRPEPAQVRAEPGETPSDYQLLVGENNTVGTAATGTVQLVDAQNNIVAQGPFGFQITEEPTFFEKYWWAFALLGLIVLGALVWLALLRKRAVDRRRVRGLSVQLHKNGEEIQPPLIPARPREFSFRFALVDDNFQEPHLVPLPSGGGGKGTDGSAEPGVFALSRDAGRIVLSPGGDRLESGATVRLANGLAMVVRDGQTPTSDFGGGDWQTGDSWTAVGPGDSWSTAPAGAGVGAAAGGTSAGGGPSAPQSNGWAGDSWSDAPGGSWNSSDPAADTVQTTRPTPSDDWSTGSSWDSGDSWDTNGSPAPASGADSWGSSSGPSWGSPDPTSSDDPWR